MKHVLALALVTFPVFVGAEEPRAQFLNEYAPTRAIFDAWEKGHECRLAITDYFKSGERTIRSSAVFNRHGFYIKDESREHKGLDGTVTRGLGTVEIGNARYWASLERKGDHEVVLKQMTENASDRAAEQYLLTATVCDLDSDQTYSELVSDPNTDVLTYGDAVWQGQPVKSLRLRFNSRLASGATVTFLNDYYFTPADWLCVGLRRRSQSKLREEVYQEVVHTLPEKRTPDTFVVARVEQHDVNEQKNTRRLERKVVLTEISPRRVTDDEITLSNFGIPEPLSGDRPPQRSWGTPHLLFLAGIGLVLVASGFLYLKRRASRRPAVRPA